MQPQKLIGVFFLTLVRQDKEIIEVSMCREGGRTIKGSYTTHTMVNILKLITRSYDRCQNKSQIILCYLSSLPQDQVHWGELFTMIQQQEIKCP